MTSEETLTEISESVSEGMADEAASEMTSEEILTEAPESVSGDTSGEAGSGTASEDTVTSSDADTQTLAEQEGVALALDVTASPVLNSYNAYFGEPVYAVVLTNSEHTDKFSMFFKYLMNES